MLHLTNLVGFASGGKNPDITVNSIGEEAENSAQTTYDYSGPFTSTDEYCLIACFWKNYAGLSRQPNTCTIDYGGANATILTRLAYLSVTSGVSSSIFGGATPSGYSAGTCRIVFSNAVVVSSIAILGLNNVVSGVEDSGTSTVTNGNTSVTLAAPSDTGGITLAAYINDTSTTAVTNSLSSEPYDTNVSWGRHSLAYEIGHSGAAITCSAANDRGTQTSVVIR